MLGSFLARTAKAGTCHEIMVRAAVAARDIFVSMPPRNSKKNTVDKEGSVRKSMAKAELVSAFSCCFAFLLPLMRAMIILDLCFRFKSARWTGHAKGWQIGFLPARSQLLSPRNSHRSPHKLRCMLSMHLAET